MKTKKPKSTRHRKPINVTISDTAREILTVAENFTGLKPAQTIERCLRQHVAKEVGYKP